jgi:4-amino-4-deoxy-L-arabinose transferase-like glycosyltransferase
MTALVAWVFRWRRRNGQRASAAGRLGAGGGSVDVGDGREARPRWALWQSPAGQPAWARPFLLVVTAVGTVSYAWRTASQQPEIYYAAAVRSMASSWHDFFFAAFDPQATISLDKLPGALWLQALSVRMFGVHLWALNLPQVIEGALTVLVLYRAVRRLVGVRAAAVAAVVSVVMPATVALNRGNISDTLLILLLVCAVDATSTAIQSGRVRHLVYAGVWVGLAFQAKMLQAWLVVPALLVVWLVAAPPRLARRMLAAAAMLMVTVVVSLSWMLIVSAVPQHDRPYVDGSTHDSLFEQVFEYNGFSRADTTDGATAGPTLSVTAGAPSLAALTQAVTLDPYPRADRTVAGPGGRAIGWLLPVAAAGAVLGMWASRRRPWADPLRAATLLWTAWLLVDIAAFTVTDTINAYYLAALTPPIAALTGIAAATATSFPQRTGARLGVAALAGATVVYGTWLLAPAPTSLRVAAAVIGLGLCLAAATITRRRTLVALIGVLVAPALASVALIVEEGGPFVTPFESATARAVSQADVAGAVRAARGSMTAITRANAGATYPAAAYTSLLAAPLIYATGTEVLPIGGFTGTAPAPTLVQLRADIRTGRLRTVLVVPTSDPRVAWVQDSCRPLPAAGKLRVYYCL